MAELSDDELVARCRDGDEQSWQELVQRYAGYVHAVARRAFAYGEDEADEVFEDTMVRLVTSLSSYRGDSPFRIWLRSVVISACRDHGRRRRPVDPLGDDDIVSPDLEPLDLVLDVRLALAALGDPCRSTLELYFLGNLTQHEVAARLGVPHGTVAARLSRCLPRLREHMQAWAPPPSSREIV